MAIDIVAENALTGNPSSEWAIQGAGDTTNLGFARQFSVNVGETMQFSCTGTGTVIDIYRIGYYGGAGWRKVTTITNTATNQPEPTTVANSNGAKTSTAWSVTASWAVPSGGVSGLYVGVYRNLAGNNASYIPFIIRNDADTADVIYKTSDATWALAYNYYGGKATPLTGSSWYGSGGPMGNITTRSHYATYHNPIVTREGIPQTYWLACEAPLIRFLERNGHKVKYVASKDLDRDSTLLSKGKVFISSGHDEYWSAPMRTNTEAYRDAGGHCLFMSGNEVFWKMRYDASRDGAWCYKDTMPGPSTHTAGTALDPVEWTGTWKDTRWANRKPENTITGTDFRSNGVYDLTAVLYKAAGYALHPVWGGSALVDSDLTFAGVVGFEADAIKPTQPEGSYKVLAEYTQNINGNYADDNGQNYNGNGDLRWGIVSQRYDSGAVVVGFGTCQWSWMLDAAHDRGSAVPVQAAAQQFTLNLLRDLGAAPASMMTGMVARPVNPLRAYGDKPSGEPRQISLMLIKGADGKFRELTRSTATLGGSSGAASATDNGDGTYTVTNVTDNGDGTYTATGSNVTDNGDGTFTVT